MSASVLPGLPAASQIRLPVLLLALLVGRVASSEGEPVASTLRSGENNRPHTFTSPASRCGECHATFYQEWVGSPHARSAQSLAYLAMRARGDAQACDTCHVPLRGKVDPAEPSISEGVTCDVCHTIPVIAPLRSGGGFSLRLDDNVKYGPLCNARPNYFHKTRCSRLHEESRLCAACHLMYRTTEDGNELPVFTEYDEWNRSEYARAGLNCQGCHMPATRMPVALGHPPRSQVHSHGFAASRSRGLRMWLSLSRKGTALEVEVQVKNERGGHALPTGLPGRQLILQASVENDRGRPTSVQERIYTRLLADAQGREVPFFLAIQLTADNRLMPEETRTESFTFPSATAGQLRVTLLSRDLSPALAAMLGLPLQERELLSIRVPLGGRAPLPKSLEITP